jgi:hypothetical protein
MQEQQLFEYAVIRVVPRVEREEFINVGLILFCKKLHFLGVKYIIDEEKIRSVSREMDISCLSESLSSLQKIADASHEGGPIAKLDTPERFRWLTATRSTILQTSRVHPGFSFDLEKTLQKLFDTLVL